MVFKLSGLLLISLLIWSTGEAIKCYDNVISSGSISEVSDCKACAIIQRVALLGSNETSDRRICLKDSYADALKTTINSICEKITSPAKLTGFDAATTMNASLFYHAKSCSTDLCNKPLFLGPPPGLKPPPPGGSGGGGANGEPPPEPEPESGSTGKCYTGEAIQAAVEGELTGVDQLVETDGCKMCLTIATYRLPIETGTTLQTLKFKCITETLDEEDFEPPKDFADMDLPNFCPSATTVSFSDTKVIKIFETRACKHPLCNKAKALKPSDERPVLPSGSGGGTAGGDSSGTGSSSSGGTENTDSKSSVQRHSALKAFAIFISFSIAVLVHVI